MLVALDHLATDGLYGAAINRVSCQDYVRLGSWKVAGYPGRLEDGSQRQRVRRSRSLTPATGNASRSECAHLREVEQLRHLQRRARSGGGDGAEGMARLSSV